MKYIEVRNSSKKSLAALAVLGTLTLAAVTSTAQPVQAQNNNSRWNRDVTITGTVVDSGNRTGVVRIQQSNGTIYTAETNNSERFRVGQNVRATGRLRNNTLRNATVTRIGGWNNGGNGNWNNGGPGGWNNGNNGNVTITGTVVDSRNQNNVVRIQQNNGRIYTAQTGRAERFSVGESVEARGYLRGNTITNATVRSLGGGWNGGNSNITVVGTVIDSQNQQNVVRFQQNNGRIYTAQTSRSERYSVGDTIEVRGRLQGSTIINPSIRRISSGGGGGTNSRISFSGIVQDSGNQYNTLRVRADDGTTYSVSTSSAANYRLNDRVRVTGYYNGSVVTGAQISRN